ncbi:MAG: hypothetical protein AAF388_00220 [Bacteroidota bacterium]
MPANKKYLTNSPWQKGAKLTAGFIGGFILSSSFHTAIASWWNRAEVVATSGFSLFLLWAGLMIVAFLAKNGWKLWGIYIAASALFAGLTYLGKVYIM